MITMKNAPKRLVFAGYAPVHFLCFLPMYRRLAADSRVEVFLSGGFREGKGDQATYRLEGFYDPFPVDHGKVIPLEQVGKEDFDVLVSAHLSDAFFPRSVRRTVQIFHGVSFKNLAVREKALRFDVLCLPGRYHADLYRKNGFVRADGSTCLITGFPKVDALANDGLDRKALLEGLELDPSRPTILFAPTGEKYNALDSMGVEVIWRIAQNPSWNLLIKPHDHPKAKTDWFKELKPLESDHVRLIRDLDVVPVLQAADLLITDASSVAVEYTLLDRPIIFLDIPKLMKRVKKRAPNLDLKTYGRAIGTVVKKPEELPEAVADCLANPNRESEIRKKMSDHVFHGPGSATERVLGVLLNAAGLEPDLPDGVGVVTPDSSPDSPPMTD